MPQRHDPDPVQAILARQRFDPAYPTWVRPSYDGYGVANLPWTVLDILGVPVAGTPLAPELVPAALRDGVRAVVLMVVDALAYHQLDKAMQRGDAPTLARLTESGAAFPLTSTFPSTTVAALTTLQTGAAPAQHGMVGYTCYLREFGMLTNLIRFGPVGRFDSFAASGIDPAGFRPVPTIYERALAAGVAAELVSYRSFQRSALTRIQATDVPFRGYRTLGEFGTVIRRALEEPGRRLIVAYWSMIDLIGHAYGPEADASVAELRLFDAMLGREIVDQAQQDDVLFVLTADHGQLQLDLTQAVSLNDEPDLLAELRLPPAGERRVGYFHPRPGREGAVRERLRALAAERGLVVDGAALLAQGLYGPEPFYPEVPSRVGELVLLARGPASFVYHTPGEAGDPMLGAHGGLEAAEMLVPCLIWRG
ncbi:MAG: alkaline phosphatase family protein [Sphaerobacter sp.]|nr:alkaline phosphatase family protein [Sphaerobacter sp.]